MFWLLHCSLYSADIGENKMKNQLQLEQIWQIISSRSLSRYNDQKTCNKQLIVVYQMGVFCAFPLFRSGNATDSELLFLIMNSFSS